MPVHKITRTSCDSDGIKVTTRAAIIVADTHTFFHFTNFHVMGFWVFYASWVPCTTAPHAFHFTFDSQSGERSGKAIATSPMPLRGCLFSPTSIIVIPY